MTSGSLKLALDLPDPDATARLGAWFGERLSAGDTLLLKGQIGSGKTHFVRAAIRARTGTSEDIPSPTFTLIQTYGSGESEIWHADLYRLTHSDEVLELGLSEALGRAICLIEWPEKLGADRPADALCIRLSARGEGRIAEVYGDERWAAKLEALSREWHV